MKNSFITLAAALSLGAYASIATAQDSGTTGSTNLPGLMQEGQQQQGSQQTGQTTGTAAIPSGQQLSQAECEQLWSTAAGESEMLSESQAEDYTENFSQVDENSDGQLSQTEFMEGCQQGSVQRLAAATGGETTASDGGADPAMPEGSTTTN